MAAPGLGDYFRAMGTIPPTRKAMATRSGRDTT